MFVGVARLVLQIPGARSLKDRRRVVKSFKDRVRARLPVSVAEIGDVELHQVATVGVAVVSGSSARCSEVLSHARSMAGSLSGAVLADSATEIVSFGSGGRSMKGGIEKALASDDQLYDELDDDDELQARWAGGRGPSPRERKGGA